MTLKSSIEILNGTKTFGENAAFRDVSFVLYPGEVHALLGENGAGKSSLMKILAGVYQLTEGKIVRGGNQILLNSPAEALNEGIAMVFQETNLVPSMTVAENLFLGDEKFFNRMRGVNILAQEHLQSLGFHVEPTAKISSLGAAKKQMVEIARAVHHKADIFIFDEPTATLTPEEKYHFFNLIKKLRKSGAAIVFITHALEEALAISDRITVLRDGQLIRTGAVGEFSRESIVRDMVGRDLESEIHVEGESRVPRPVGAPVLGLRDLSMGKIVRGATMTAYSGQVTGMFGLIGAGRSEMMKIAAGVLKRDYFHGGQVVLDGKSVHFRVPAQAVKEGLVYVTEDRKLDGMFDTLSISENIFLGKLARDTSQKIVRNSDVISVASKWIEALKVRAINPSSKLVELSGGNQQKVVIAKSLAQIPKVIIFDEPTRGVDVGAIAEIHRIISDLADEGMTVIVISSYLPEIFALSDRILVTRLGSIAEEMTIEEADEERIMYAAVH